MTYQAEGYWQHGGDARGADVCVTLVGSDFWLVDCTTPDYDYYLDGQRCPFGPQPPAPDPRLEAEIQSRRRTRDLADKIDRLRTHRDGVALANVLQDLPIRDQYGQLDWPMEVQRELRRRLDLRLQEFALAR